MGLLCLVPLILLSQPFLIQPVFQQVNVHCDHGSNETTACLLDDSCSWKADLASCQTLQMHCIEHDGWGSERFCTSSEECGFSNFPDILIGVVDCEITKAKNKHEIKCQLNVECGFAKYICVTPKECHWNPNEQFKEISDARCVLQHDVSHCIKVNPKLNLTEDLNCTITSSKNHPNAGTETGGQCDNKPSEGQNHGCITSITVNVILGIVVIATVTILCITRRKRTNQRRDSGGL